MNHIIKQLDNSNELEGIVKFRNEDYMRLRGDFNLKELDKEVQIEFGCNKFCVNKNTVKVLEFIEGHFFYVSATTSNYDLEIKEKRQEYNVKEDVLYKQFINILSKTYEEGGRLIYNIRLNQTRFNHEVKIEDLYIKDQHITCELEQGNIDLDLKNIDNISYISIENLKTYILETNKNYIEFCFFTSC